MSLDTKYRPNQFDSVIGQEGSVRVLREFIKAGEGFQQSYIFAGAKGCGKTTLGRILARALLCESPVDGNPCDECPSCLEMLQDPPGNECYTEMDAATNSGKETIQGIVETQQYESFSGRNRIYLIDECHRLSKQAMDGLLKPMEDTVPGSQNKVLVCIFCTTEPDKVVGTISSRCAPVFQIKQVDPETIAKRCEEVCKDEGIEYEFEALVLIAEVTGCHFRDALNSVAGVSKLGSVNMDTVREYMNLGASSSYLRILSNLGSDPNAIVEEVEMLKELVSPSTCYTELADASIAIYKNLKFKVGAIPSYWDKTLLEPFSGPKLEGLLEISSWLAKRPARATYPMLSCELLILSQRVSQGVSLSTDTIVVTAGAGQQVAQPAAQPAPSPTAQLPAPAGKVVESEPESSGQTVTNGVFIDPRCVKKGPEVAEASSDPQLDILDLDLARRLLQSRLRELGNGSRRHAR